ncbi:MAG TPA: hypothetical protein VFE46_18535, partial [Pirellulales bacterium]|nr:hypothetical protein [Pirellulales bacterium]
MDWSLDWRGRHDCICLDWLCRWHDRSDHAFNTAHKKQRLEQTLMAMLSPALKQRIAELRIAGRAGILALLLASVCLVVLPLTFLRAGLDGVL